MVSVLVVDDDKLIRSLLRELLTKKGYKVETIESGVMAIKKVLKQGSSRRYFLLFCPAL